MSRSTRVCLYIFCTAFALAILVYPAEHAQSARNGLALFVSSVLHTLLPFFFLTSLITTAGIPKTNSLSRITEKLYKTPSSDGYVTLMSVVAGYPMSAKLLGELYLAGAIDESDAESITAHSSLPGPMFILGTVGTGLLHDGRMGVILLVIQILASLINGFLYRGKPRPQRPYIPAMKSTKNLFGSAGSSAIQSALSVGVFITLSAILLRSISLVGITDVLAETIGVFGIDKNLTCGVVSCIVEITCGIAGLASSHLATLPVTSFALAFGGLSVGAQSVGLASGALHAKRYFLIKFTQGIIALLISLPIQFLI